MTSLLTQEVEQSEPEQDSPELIGVQRPDSEPQTETNSEEAKQPNKLQERLDKLTAEKYEAKRRADELEQKLKGAGKQSAISTITRGFSCPR